MQTFLHRMTAAFLAAAFAGPATRPTLPAAAARSSLLIRPARRRGRLSATLLVALAAAFALPSAGAATKYVSASSGDDTHDGNTMATAYATIAKGLQNIGTGGRLYIGGGTYAEAIINTIPSGTSNAARTIVTNYQNEIVTIRPASGSGFARVLEFSGAVNYITVAGNAPGQIILDGVYVANNVVKFSASGSNGTGSWPEYIKLEHLEIKNCPDSGVLGYPRYCDFLKLKIHDAGNSDLDHGMYIEGSDNIIDGCEIYSNYARGIQIYMQSQQGSTYFASRNTVRNCRIYNNGLPNSKPGIDTDAGTGNRVYNNLIYDNGGYGVYVFYGATDTEVYNNTIYSNGSYGVYIKGGSGIAGPGTKVRNNIGYLNGSQDFFDERGDATASNNLWGTNPQFASTTPGNSEFLKLTASSTAAINQGTSTAPINTLVTADFWGDARPQGGSYDIGADEYVSTGVPAAPATLAATKAASPDNFRQINLSWSDVASETGYRIERKTRVDGTYAEIATVGANVVTYSDSTCGCGTTYYYRVRAYNANGNSAYSPEANAVTDEVATRTAHWKLNEGSGTSTSDSSGNANHGTLANGPAWVTGKIGSGLDFDGADDVVNCGSGTSVDNLSALTVCAWIKADTMGEGGLARIVQKSAWSPQAGWFFHLTGTNQLGFSVDFSSPKLARISGTNAFPTGSWCHVMVTWTGSATATNARIYVNGTEVGSYATTTNGGGARIDDSASSLYLGNDSTGVRSFDGSIDDVRLYARVLTTNEILAIYRAGL